MGEKKETETMSDKQNVRARERKEGERTKAKGVRKTTSESGDA